MKLLVRFALAVVAVGGATGSLPAYAQVIVTLGSGVNQPEGVAVDGNGNVFVVDSGNNAMRFSRTGWNLGRPPQSTTYLGCIGA
jgi:uncharacterized protein YjiK